MDEEILDDNEVPDERGPKHFSLGHGNDEGTGGILKVANPSTPTLNPKP